MAVLRNMRPRDQQGWRVPRRGTLSADIYALAKKGLSATQIAKQLGRTRNNVQVHLFKIKRPERANQFGRSWKDRRPHAPKKMTQAEAHARKD